MIKIFSIFLSFLVASPFAAQSVLLSDSARVSLLTNSPWDGAVYTVFGHTAIRVSDEANNIDWIFNYGVFDYDAPDFMLRFVKGETDYMLAAYPFRYFLEEYQSRGVSTCEQLLNLTQAEKQRMWDALYINALPANREYRYNFFFDNCATRPRDIIEHCINGNIRYTPNGKQLTFRNMVHECVSSYPWLMFGIDLLIGSDADREATDREKMFLPLYLEQACSRATVESPNETARRLILNESTLIPAANSVNNSGTANYPLITGFIVLAAAVAVSALSYRKRLRLAVIYDVLLFAIAGLAGCIIAFLVFFSEHPATSPNWNLMWLNPLQLAIAFFIPIKYFSKGIYSCHFINFALLSLFAASYFFLPQQFEPAFLPYVFSLWLRSGTNIVQRMTDLHYDKK
jgi:hypothetical protein